VCVWIGFFFGSLVSLVFCLLVQNVPFFPPHWLCAMMEEQKKVQ